MRASQADSVVSTSTTAPLQVSISLHGVVGLPRTAAQLLTSAAGAACTQVPELLSGKFYYADGSTYEGQYKLLGLVPAADAVPAKKGLKKKEDEAPAQPAEPPKPVRHGAGQASQLLCLAHHDGLMLGFLKSGTFVHPTACWDSGSSSSSSGGVCWLALPNQLCWPRQSYSRLSTRQLRCMHCTPAGTLTCGSYSYTGDWVDDEMHGQGRFTFASGASYQGCFEHNKFSGEGNYTFPDGKQYQVSASLPAG